MTVNLFVDGRGYVGQIDGYNPPVALDTGQEGLATSFALTNYDADVLALFGVVAGEMVTFTIRGELERDHETVKRMEHVIRGRITTIECGALRPGQKPALTVTMRLDHHMAVHSPRGADGASSPRMSGKAVVLRLKR
ncbi:phage major tail tube protein [Paracoccus siganidrum]|uniref:Phage tail protein n=1 Tax=Paracoccus siganidrum TaxID=1276757 RepID=A0A419A4I5_9RHOB|nr:phage major tail tube protein [Paracoccus siganidrum]RJL09434.1 phage tail protein [Paracoccus siganidrum]RMC38998.1 phage tail protein [Paracoccus siganidrum]